MSKNVQIYYRLKKIVWGSPFSWKGPQSHMKVGTLGLRQQLCVDVTVSATTTRLFNTSLLY